MSNATRACNIQKDEQSNFPLGGRSWDWRLGTGVGNRLKQIGNRDRQQKLEAIIKKKGLGTGIMNRGWEPW